MFGGVRKKLKKDKEKPPKFVKTLPPTHIQKVGTILELEVQAEPSKDELIFEWTKPSYTDGVGERIKFISEGERSLCRVTPVVIQDEGDWRCELRSKKSGSSKNIIKGEETCCGLVIYVPKSYRIPTFLEELEARISPNGTVALECKVVGVPTPRLLWFKDDKELKAGDTYELKAENNKPTTTYKCVAINCIGSAMSETVLKITSSKNIASPKILFGLTDFKIKIGTDVEFYVKVIEDALPCTATWYHNEALVHPNQRYIIKETANEFRLIIKAIQLTDDGLWACEIVNDLGKVREECKVTLKVPKNYRKPTFVEKLRANLTDEGLVSFECKVVGFPTPVLTWLKDGQELRPGDVYQLYGNQAIGVYTCVARNCMGEAKSTSALTLEDLENKPKKAIEILVPLKDIELKYGESCQLFVQASSNLQLPSTWRKDGIKVGFPRYITGCEDDGKYFCNIIDATKEDEGSWECLLENGEEILSTFGIVKVIIPRHFKAPNFLEELQIFIGENGNVNLECKVIGIPQPTLLWYKDDKELQAGDIQQLTSGGRAGDNPKACIFGKYKCVARNCMGEAVSEASLIDKGDEPLEERSRSSIIDSPNNSEPQKDIIEEIDVSESLGQTDRSVMLSISDVPDISAENAKKIVEMFSKELSESISDSNMVELPPLRFVRETSRSDKVQIEAVVIDIDEQELEEAERHTSTMEDVDEETVNDVEDIFSADGDPDSDMLDVDVIEDANEKPCIKKLLESSMSKGSKDSEVVDGKRSSIEPDDDKNINSEKPEQRERKPVEQGEEEHKIEEKPDEIPHLKDVSDLHARQDKPEEKDLTEDQNLEEESNKISNVSSEQVSMAENPINNSIRETKPDKEDTDDLFIEDPEDIELKEATMTNMTQNLWHMVKEEAVKERKHLSEEEIKVSEKFDLEIDHVVPNDIPEEMQEQNLRNVDEAIEMVKEGSPEEPAEKINFKTAQKEVLELEDLIEISKQDNAEKPISDNEGKNVVDLEDDADVEKDFQRKRSNSYEETLKNMDPELLRELGILDRDTDTEGEKISNSDLSARVEEKALELIQDIPPPVLMRSRSRSRSRSKPPSLDTVEENYSAEYQEALYYKSQLEDIRESSSCSSVPSQIKGSPSASSRNSVEKLLQHIPKKDEPPEVLEKHLEENVKALEEKKLNEQSTEVSHDQTKQNESSGKKLDIRKVETAEGSVKTNELKEIRSKELKVQLEHLKQELLSTQKPEQLLIKCLSKSVEAFKNPEAVIQDLQLMKQGQHIQELQQLQKPKLQSPRGSLEEPPSKKDIEILRRIQEKFKPILEIPSKQNDEEYSEICKELLKHLQASPEACDIILSDEKGNDNPEQEIILLQQDIAQVVQNQLLENEKKKLTSQKEKLKEQMEQMKASKDFTKEELQAKERLENQIKHQLNEIRELQKPLMQLNKDMEVIKLDICQPEEKQKARLIQQLQLEQQLIRFQKFQEIKEQRKELFQIQLEQEIGVQLHHLQRQAKPQLNFSTESLNDEKKYSSSENLEQILAKKVEAFDKALEESSKYGNKQNLEKGNNESKRDVTAAFEHESIETELSDTNAFHEPSDSELEDNEIPEEAMEDTEIDAIKAKGNDVFMTTTTTTHSIPTSDNNSVVEPGDVCATNKVQADELDVKTNTSGDSNITLSNDTVIKIEISDKKPAPVESKTIHEPLKRDILPSESQVNADIRTESFLTKGKVDFDKEFETGSNSKNLVSQKDTLVDDQDEATKEVDEKNNYTLKSKISKKAGKFFKALKGKSDNNNGKASSSSVVQQSQVEQSKELNQSDVTSDKESSEHSDDSRSKQTKVESDQLEKNEIKEELDNDSVNSYAEDEASVITVARAETLTKHSSEHDLLLIRDLPVDQSEKKQDDDKVAKTETKEKAQEMVGIQGEKNESVPEHGFSLKDVSTSNDSTLPTVKANIDGLKDTHLNNKVSTDEILPANSESLFENNGILISDEKNGEFVTENIQASEEDTDNLVATSNKNVNVPVKFDKECEFLDPSGALSKSHELEREDLTESSHQKESQPLQSEETEGELRIRKSESKNKSDEAFESQTFKYDDQLKNDRNGGQEVIQGHKDTRVSNKVDSVTVPSKNINKNTHQISSSEERYENKETNVQATDENFKITDSSLESSKILQLESGETSEPFQEVTVEPLGDIGRNVDLVEAKERNDEVTEPCESMINIENRTFSPNTFEDIGQEKECFLGNINGEATIKEIDQSSKPDVQADETIVNKPLEEVGRSEDTKSNYTEKEFRKSSLEEKEDLNKEEVVSGKDIPETSVTKTESNSTSLNEDTVMDKDISREEERSKSEARLDYSSEREINQKEVDQETSNLKCVEAEIVVDAQDKSAKSNSLGLRIQDKLPTLKTENEEHNGSNERVKSERETEKVSLDDDVLNKQFTVKTNMDDSNKLDFDIRVLDNISNEVTTSDKNNREIIDRNLQTLEKDVQKNEPDSASEEKKSTVVTEIDVTHQRHQLETKTNDENLNKSESETKFVPNPNEKGHEEQLMKPKEVVPKEQNTQKAISSTKLIDADKKVTNSMPVEQSEVHLSGSEIEQNIPETTQQREIHLDKSTEKDFDAEKQNSSDDTGNKLTSVKLENVDEGRKIAQNLESDEAKSFAKFNNAVVDTAFKDVNNLSDGFNIIHPKEQHHVDGDYEMKNSGEIISEENSNTENESWNKLVLSKAKAEDEVEHSVNQISETESNKSNQNLTPVKEEKEPIVNREDKRDEFTAQYNDKEIKEFQISEDTSNQIEFDDLSKQRPKLEEKVQEKKVLEELEVPHLSENQKASKEGIALEEKITVSHNEEDKRPKRRKDKKPQKNGKNGKEHKKSVEKIEDGNREDFENQNSVLASNETFPQDRKSSLVDENEKSPQPVKRQRSSSRPRLKSPEHARRESFDKHLIEMKKALQKTPDSPKAQRKNSQSLSRNVSFKGSQQEIKSEEVKQASDKEASPKETSDSHSSERNSPRDSVTEIPVDKKDIEPLIEKKELEEESESEEEKEVEDVPVSAALKIPVKEVEQEKQHDVSPPKPDSVERNELENQKESRIDLKDVPKAKPKETYGTKDESKLSNKEGEKKYVSSTQISKDRSHILNYSSSLSFNFSKDNKSELQKSKKKAENVIYSSGITIEVDEPQWRRTTGIKKEDLQSIPESDTIKANQDIFGYDAVVNVKEIGPDWVSLTWKKPETKKKIPPIVTYKVEAWLCGEGAYWVEVGRSPITQFEAFNLKPNRQYYFRVTAKSARGVEFEMITRGKVDLSKSTKGPKFTQKMPNYLRVLQGEPMQLQCQFYGEPLPDVRWTHTRHQPKVITSATSDEIVNSGQDGKTAQKVSTYRVASVKDNSFGGKYSCDISNISGRTSSFCYVDIVKDKRVFKSYEKAKRLLEESSDKLDGSIFPCFVVSPRDRRIESGCPIQFMCKPLGNPPPIVKWFRKGEEIKNSDEVRTSTKDGFFYLSFDSVKVDDVGQYEAVASNEVGEVVSKFMLIVDEGLDDHYGPQFVKPLGLVDGANPKENVIIQTRISASPYVNINWYHNGCKIHPSSKVHKYFDKDGTASLSLVGQDCSGQFTCTAFNEGGENTVSITVPKNDVEREATFQQVFKSMPKVELVKDKIMIKCQLANHGEVHLSTIPKTEYKQKSFQRTSNNVFSLELSEADEEDRKFCGRVAYVIAKCGQNSVIYPVWTNVECKSRQFPMISSSKKPKLKKPLSCDNAEGPIEAFCRSGDEMSLGLGRLAEISKAKKATGGTVTLTRIDTDSLVSRPSFTLNEDEFEVLFEGGVSKEDEGVYEVEVKDEKGESKKKFNYVLVVLDKLEQSVKSFVDTSDLELDMHLANRVSRGPTPLRQYLSPRHTPFTSPRATPSRQPTPSRLEQREPTPVRRSHINPRIISGLSDVNTTPGQTGEIKCYLLTVPGLETRWEKDGQPINVTSDLRIRTFESRGVRGMTIRQLKEEDSGTYSVRILGPTTNLYSQCRISVIGRRAPSVSPGLLMERAKRSSDYFSSYRRSKFSRSLW